MSKLDRDRLIKEKLEKSHDCYVLITCNYRDDGKMDVSLDYQGNETLVSYLLEGAKASVDEQLEHAEETHEAIS